MGQNVAFSRRLKSLCAERGITFQMLAEMISVPERRAYRMMYIGESNPGAYMMLRICKAFGMTVEEFFDSEEFADMDQFRM